MVGEDLGTVEPWVRGLSAVPWTAGDVHSVVRTGSKWRTECATAGGSMA